MQNAHLKDNSSINLEPDFDYNYGNQSQPNKSVSKKPFKEQTSFNRSNISPDAIIFTNEKGEITYINLEAQELTGWYITDAMSKKTRQVFNIFDPETMQQLDDPISRVLDTDSRIELTQDIVLRSKDNLKFEIQYKASPKYKDNGELNKIILTFKKLKEIKDAAPKKEQRTEKIEKQSKPKDLLISDQSFDDKDNDTVTKTEKQIKNGIEKESPLKVASEQEKIDKKEVLNSKTSDHNFSIELEIDDEETKDYSQKDSIDYETKTVKKIYTDSLKNDSNVYSISNDDLEDLESLDFLNEV